MASALDKSLDEVISSRPKNKRRAFRRSSAKATLVGTPATVAVKSVPAVRKAEKPQTQPVAPHSQKIIVSNLPHDVNEAQIEELFTHAIGPTKSVTLNYDHTGRSKGVASVVFTRSGDGTRAYQEYHNRLIDGKRPMKVEIVLDPSRVSQPTLSQRVGPALTSQKATTVVRGIVRNKKNVKGRKKRTGDRPNKSAADLDAEMADYTGATMNTT